MFKDLFRGVFPTGSIKGDSVPLERFSGEAVIMPDYGQNVDVPRIFKKHHIDVAYTDDRMDNRSVLAAVAAGLGVTIMPQLELDYYAVQNVVTLPLEPRQYREMGVATPRGGQPDPIAQEFVRYLKQVSKKSKSLRSTRRKHKKKKSVCNGLLFLCFSLSKNYPSAPVSAIICYNRRNGGVYMEGWRKDARHEPIIVDLEALVPKEHLLRKIEKVMDYEWLYERLDPYYCHDNGRPGTDPVVLVKMVLIQHLFGIPSLRQTYREIQVNNAYRWFLGYGLLDNIPHFATVSYAFCKHFPEELTSEIFEHIH